MTKPLAIERRKTVATLRDTIPLQKVKIIKKSIKGTIVVVLVCGFMSIFMLWFLFGEAEGAPEIVQKVGKYLAIVFYVFVATLLCWYPIYQYLYFKRYFYDMDEKNILIRKGVLAQKEITLPFSRITDVYVDQDILDVVFGIYDVHISTPTEQSGLFAHIDGVNKEGSQKLPQMILDRIGEEDS